MYVAGGFNENYCLYTCEGYGIKKNKWFPSQHALPQILRRAKSAVIADESFAVFTGEITGEYRTDGTITFMEQNGFQQFANVAMKYQRSDRVKMCITK